METHSSRTVIEKLAYVLRKSPEELPYLEKLSKTELENLHSVTVSRVYSESNPAWEKLAAVAKFIPNFINARIAEDILGEEITASLSYHLPVKDAVSISGHLKTPFLGRVAERLVPEKAVDLILAYPLKDLLRIVDELLRNKKHYTMGTFVDFLPHNRLHEIATEIKSEEELMRIAVYASRKDHLAGMLEGFTDDRILKLLEATEVLGFWGDILEIISHFSTELKKRFSTLFQRMSDSIVLSLVTEGNQYSLLSDFLSIMIYFTEDDKSRMAGLVPQMHDDVLLGFIKNGTKKEFGELILSVADDLDEAQYQRVGVMIPKLSPDELEKISKIAYESGLEKPIFLFLRSVPMESRDMVADVFARFSAQDRENIERKAKDLGVYSQIEFLFQ